MVLSLRSTHPLSARPVPIESYDRGGCGAYDNSIFIFGNSRFILKVIHSYIIYMHTGRVGYETVVECWIDYILIE